MDCPEEPKKIQLELLTDVIATFEKDYDYLMKRWYTFEEKAKNNITIGGVFLGGLFGLVKESDFDTLSVDSTFYCLTIGMIICCIVSASLVIKSIRTSLPYLGDKSLEDFNNISKMNSFNSEIHIGYIYEKSMRWNLIMTEKMDDVKLKSKYLTYSNFFLITSVVCFGLFAVFYKFMDNYIQE